MSLLRCVIIDDEPLARSGLRRYLSAFPGLEVVGEAGTKDEALMLIESLQPNLLTLDIDMPGAHGFELLAALSAPPAVVFVTAYDQYAVDAFYRQAADYLLKPVTDDRLQRTIARLQDRLAKKEAPQDVAAILASIAKALPSTKSRYLRWIRASVGELTKQIAVDDVLYFQALDKYVSVYTKDGGRESESLIRTSLSELICRTVRPGSLLANSPLHGGERRAHRRHHTRRDGPYNGEAKRRKGGAAGEPRL